MYRTMRDLIMPKLVFLDLPLFIALLTDLFPGVEIPPEATSALRRELEKQLLAAGLQVVPEYVTKIIQIFDCKARCMRLVTQSARRSGAHPPDRALTAAVLRFCDAAAEGPRVFGSRRRLGSGTRY